MSITSRIQRGGKTRPGPEDRPSIADAETRVIEILAAEEGPLAAEAIAGFAGLPLKVVADTIAKLAIDGIIGGDEAGGYFTK